MDADQIYLEIFEKNFRNYKMSLERKDYVGAKKSLILSAKILYEMAANSFDDKEREVRFIQAENVKALIHALDEKIRKEKERAVFEVNEKSREKVSPESHLMSKSDTGRNNSGGREDDDKAVIVAMDVPSISFDDVVGLSDVKASVRKKIIEPRLHPGLFEKYKMKRGGGILMYGPPGTGKSMIAQATAHEINAKFFSLRCSELVSRFFGGTEQNIKALFDTARKEKNAVIFFDEFDALAISRDKNHSSIMKRVVTELLAQMQGIHESKDSCLLVLAATNKPWMMDSAFMRPGRFDDCIYVGLPDDEARKGILKKSLRGVPVSNDIDIPFIVEKTNGFNAADVVELVEKTKDYPYKREIATGMGQVITMEDFNNALKICHSSVDRSDIEKLMKWQNDRA